MGCVREIISSLIKVKEIISLKNDSFEIQNHVFLFRPVSVSSKWQAGARSDTGLVKKKKLNVKEKGRGKKTETKSQTLSSIAQHWWRPWYRRVVTSQLLFFTSFGGRLDPQHR